MKKNYISPLANIARTDFNVVLAASSPGQASEWQQGQTGEGHGTGTPGIGPTDPEEEYDQGTKRRGYFYN